MKTLGEIIDMAMNGEKPDYDDMRYAICAMSALMSFDRMALSSLSKGEKEKKRPILTYSASFQYEERFNRLKTAYSRTPKEWLGPNNDPDSEEVQRRKKMHTKLVDKIINSMAESE
jgi:hypothetical protein